MSRLLIIFLLCCCADIKGQSLDFIAVKKRNGITIKSFTAGAPIIFNTYHGKHIEGYIQRIKNDSVWVTGYNIQIIPTRLGVTMVDTASVYVTKTFYKDIKSIYINKKAKRIPMLLSKILLFGGGGFIALNSANHLLHGDGRLYTQKKNYQRLARAGVAAVTGLAGYLFFRKTGFSRKHHEIVYINLQ